MQPIKTRIGLIFLALIIQVIAQWKVNNIKHRLQYINIP